MISYHSIPFYQSEWHGISLVEIAKEIGLPINNLPDSNFYKIFYEKLRNADFPFSEDWKQGKQRMSQWMRDRYLRYASREKKSISVGAGLGIVETPLITEGFDIDLQDCQEESQAFFQEKNGKKGIYYTCPLSSIPKDKYDLCFCIAMTYALTEKELSSFLQDVGRILKPGGFFVWLDTSLSWYEIYSFLKNRSSLKNSNVLWGYKRSMGFQKKLSIRQNFRMISSHYYNGKMNEIFPKTIREIPCGYNIQPTWQELILRKPFYI